MHILFALIFAGALVPSTPVPNDMRHPYHRSTSVSQYVEELAIEAIADRSFIATKADGSLFLIVARRYHSSCWNDSNAFPCQEAPQSRCLRHAEALEHFPGHPEASVEILSRCVAQQVYHELVVRITNMDERTLNRLLFSDTAWQRRERIKYYNSYWQQQGKDADRAQLDCNLDIRFLHRIAHQQQMNLEMPLRCEFKDSGYQLHYRLTERAH